MRTFRCACGDGIGLRLDLNYNFRTEGFCEIASALTPAALGRNHCHTVNFLVFMDLLCNIFAPCHSIRVSVHCTLTHGIHYSLIQGGRGLDWLELDTQSPSALRRVRDRAAMPIASLESVMGRRALLPFLEADAVDVAIVDPLWNGVDESCKMAALCDIFEVERISVKIFALVYFMSRIGPRLFSTFKMLTCRY